MTAVLLVACSASPQRPVPTTPAPAVPPMADGAASIDDLVDRFLAALERKDLEALERLRVDRAQYLDIIVPGSVEPGTPPRTLSEKPREYFWSVLDFKSREIARVLAERFGGRHYRSHAYQLTHPPRQYAWYRAHGEIRLLLEDEEQTVYRLQTGWIAEVGGRYKFIGYESDD